MKRQYYAIENGRVITVESERKGDLVSFFGHGNVFDTRKEAETIRDERNAPKVHHLTDEERKATEIEQQKYGWAMFTDEEKAEIKAKYKYVNGVRVLKTIDDYQLEFARQMMRLEAV